jgi:beta-glucosidase
MAVVLMNGSALSVNWAAKNADAILDAWYSGEEGGNAIGQTLAGDNNPSGHLPVTFYTGVDQLPAFDDYSMTNRTYRYFTRKPLYPFGYGLSFTRFTYGGLKVAPSVKAGEALSVDVTVKNVGARYGEAVPQLYLGFPGAAGQPIRALRGINRVALQAGESRNVHFDLSARDLSSVTVAGDRVVAPGAYRIAIGDGQPGTGAVTVEKKLTITGTAPLPQ